MTIWTRLTTLGFGRRDNFIPIAVLSLATKREPGFRSPLTKEDTADGDGHPSMD